MTSKLMCIVLLSGCMAGSLDEPGPASGDDGTDPSGDPGGGGSGTGGGGGGSSTPQPTGPSQVSLSGIVLGIGGNIAYVDIAAFTRAGVPVGAPVHTAPDSTFTITVPTTNGAFDGYFMATNDGIATYVWPAVPMTADVADLRIESVGKAPFLQGSLYTVCGGGTYNPAKSTIGVRVATMAGGAPTGLAGAKVMLPAGAGTVCYNKKFPSGNEVPDPTPKVTDESGVAYLLNVPASNSVVLDASLTGMTFTKTTIPIVANTYTVAFVVAQ